MGNEGQYYHFTKKETFNAKGLGTKNNPILFADYVKLFKNVYYFYQGVIYQYVGSRIDNAIDWDDVKEDMKEV